MVLTRTLTTAALISALAAVPAPAAKRRALEPFSTCGELVSYAKKHGTRAVRTGWAPEPQFLEFSQSIEQGFVIMAQEVIAAAKLAHGGVTGSGLIQPLEKKVLGFIALIAQPVTPPEGRTPGNSGHQASAAAFRSAGAKLPPSSRYPNPRTVTR